MNEKWYCIEKGDGIHCINCNVYSKIVGLIHTDGNVCPNCKIECLYTQIGEEHIIQILPNRTPEVFKKFIFWVQSDLDELEFLFLKALFVIIGKEIAKDTQMSFTSEEEE